MVSQRLAHQQQSEFRFSCGAMIHLDWQPLKRIMFAWSGSPRTVLAGHLRDEPIVAGNDSQVRSNSSSSMLTC